MKPAALERLVPIIRHKAARTRLILYLVANGYTVQELHTMTVADLLAVDLPVSFAAHREEVLDGRTTKDKRGYAFMYPNGNEMPLAAFKRIIRETTFSVLGVTLAQVNFRRYITSGRYGND